MVDNRSDIQHHIAIRNRRAIDISGVIDVESFDSEEFLLRTEAGFLVVRGNNLHIKNLDLAQGKVAIEGVVDDLGYLEEGAHSEKARGFFSRLFK
jgi:sporulation protein YabP